MLTSQLKKPSLRTSKTSLYMQAPTFLEEQTRPNLEKLLSSLIDEGEEITVTDSNLPISITLAISFSVA